MSQRQTVSQKAGIFVSMSACVTRRWNILRVVESVPSQDVAGGSSVSQFQRVLTGSRNILRVIAASQERVCHRVESVSHF